MTDLAKKDLKPKKKGATFQEVRSLMWEHRGKLAFGFVLMLGEGDVWFFAIICVASGATIGADLTLLPAMFARRMADVAPNGGQGFGLWAMVSKFTLAFAAAVLLPILEGTRFTSGASDNPTEALRMLTILYALVPCTLKLVAIGLLMTTKLEE